MDHIVRKLLNTLPANLTQAVIKNVWDGDKLKRIIAISVRPGYEDRLSLPKEFMGHEVQKVRWVR